MAIPKLDSRIEKAKVYSVGATVTRIAELALAGENLPEKVEIAGLPLALDDSSVRVRVEVDGGSAPLACDIRVGLTVPPPQTTESSPTDEEISAAELVVEQLRDLIALLEHEINLLNNLEIPNRPKGEPGKAPPPSPTSARKAIANFCDEQIRERLKEKRDNLEKLRLAKENLADLKQKRRLASSAKEAKPDELRKTIIVSLNYGDTLPNNARLVLEYFVPGARWTPTYICRLNSRESTASIAVRAFINQYTGEDWAGVRLELSTANPISWRALPELPSLRLGKAQFVPQKSGWRKPPVGSDILFADYDSQKQPAFLKVQKPSFESFPQVEFPEIEKLETILEESKIIALRSRVADDEIYERKRTGAIEEDYDNDDFAYEAIPDFDNQTRGISLPAPASPAVAGSMYALSEPPAPTRTARRKAVSKPGLQKPDNTSESIPNQLLAYNLMRMGEAEEPIKRGKLSIDLDSDYLESLKRQQVVVNYPAIVIIEAAVRKARECSNIPLPTDTSKVREAAGNFDYAYIADGRVDVPSDGQFHSVALMEKSTDVEVRYIVVPREDTNVFRVSQLRNPLQAPLLAAPADIYVDGEYILSTKIDTVPALGQMELGLGVEQAIKVARNTFYQEVRSGETIVAFNELRHKVQIEITNLLPRLAKIEVRERIPVPNDGAKIDVEINRVSPDWEKYEQVERSAPVKGGYRWYVEVPAQQQTNLFVDYTIKTFVDSELVNGNRREG